MLFRLFYSNQLNHVGSTRWNLKKTINKSTDVIYVTLTTDQLLQIPNRIQRKLHRYRHFHYYNTVIDLYQVIQLWRFVFLTIMRCVIHIKSNQHGKCHINRHFFYMSMDHELTNEIHVSNVNSTHHSLIYISFIEFVYFSCIIFNVRHHLWFNYRIYSESRQIMCAAFYEPYIYMHELTMYIKLNQLSRWTNSCNCSRWALFKCTALIHDKHCSCTKTKLWWTQSMK